MYLDVDQVHLLADALHGGFRAQGSYVGTHETVRLTSDSLGVHVVIQLHVPRVDSEDFQAACSGNTHNFHCYYPQKVEQNRGVTLHFRHFERCTFQEQELLSKANAIVSERIFFLVKLPVAQFLQASCCCSKSKDRRCGMPLSKLFGHIPERGVYNNT